MYHTFFNIKKEKKKIFFFFVVNLNLKLIISGKEFNKIF